MITWIRTETGYIIRDTDMFGRPGTGPISILTVQMVIGYGPTSMDGCGHRIMIGDGQPFIMVDGSMILIMDGCGSPIMNGRRPG